MTPEIFRQQYPQGGLVSELAAIEHGQYVVRVLVQNDGVTLSSGLAAAASVEQAEDQARARALGLLASGSGMAAPRPAKKAAPAIATPPIPVPSPTSMPVPAPAAPKPAPVAAPTEFTYDLPLSAPPEPEPAPAPAPAPVPAAPPAVEEPLDFSDIIARSDVELKRLGWTSEQGRNYLLETYGKRSRQLLSDAELLEFLRFLEGQPSP